MVCIRTLHRVKGRFLSVIFSLLVRQRFPFDIEMCTLYTNVCQIYIARDPINPMVWFRRAPAYIGSDIYCTTSQFFISTLYTFLTTLHSTLGQNPRLSFLKIYLYIALFQSFLLTPTIALCRPARIKCTLPK